MAWGDRFELLLWILGIPLSILSAATITRFAKRRLGVIWVTTGHGQSVALPRGSVVTVGGPGGIGPEDIPSVARLIRGQGTKLFMEPTGLTETAIKCNGTAVTGKTPYTLGVPLLCTVGDKEEQITITRTTRPRPHPQGGDVPLGQDLLSEDLL